MNRPMRSGSRQRVLFVGSFVPPSATKVRGGVQFECQSLIDSPVSASVEWSLLDTTMESLPPPPLRRRLVLATRRLLRFGIQLVFNRPDSCLIYVSSGASFIEKGAMALSARILGVRVVLRPVSGLIIDDYRKSRVFRWFVRLVLRATDVVACQGTRWCEFYQSVGDLPSSRTPLVYNPVDASKYATLKTSGHSSPNKALLIGWVEQNKGIWDLLKLVRRFAPELEGMQFVICGKGSEFEEFVAAIARDNLGRFFDMRGWVDMNEKLAVLAECEIYLMLSHREGLPNALLEAMAAGRAVVATAVGSVPDLVRQGETGLLCEPKDVEDMGNCILELRNNPQLRQRLGLAAQQRIIHTLDYEVVWRQWADILLRKPAVSPLRTETV